MSDESPVQAYLARLRSQLHRAGRPAGRAQREALDHLTDATQRLQASGLSHHDAEQRAVEEFGSPEIVVAAFKDQGGPLMFARLKRWSLPMSVVFLIPAASFIVANILKYGLGEGSLYDGVFGSAFDMPFGTVEVGWLGIDVQPFEIIVNLLIIAGPLAALALTALASVDLELGRHDGRFTVAIAVRLERARLAVIVTSALLFGTLAGYVLIENLPCLVGGRLEC